MDYKTIARAITDPENQPHQWNEQDLAKFFISAADEIERLRELLGDVLIMSSEDIPYWLQLDIRSTLQQKESK